MPHAANIVPQKGKNHSETGIATVSYQITTVTSVQIWEFVRTISGDPATNPLG
jgi:hypothetical protein